MGQTTSSSSSAANNKKKPPRSYLDEMEAPSDVEVPRLFVHPFGTRELKAKRKSWRPDAMNRVSLLILQANEPGHLLAEVAALRSRLDATSNGLSRRELHAYGALVALVVGDALGAPLEFRSLSYDAAAQPRVVGFDDAVWRTQGCNKFGLLPGQWTDDASMALCLAESLIAHGALHPHDLRLRFMLWWNLDRKSVV